jgi:hypothetical protein
MTRRLIIPVALVLLGATASLHANWPHWRGPSANGLSSETNLPVTWSRTENITWREGRTQFELLAQNDLGEYTLSSPAVSEGQLFLRTDAALYAIGTRRK